MTNTPAYSYFGLDAWLASHRHKKTYSSVRRHISSRLPLSRMFFAKSVWQESPENTSVSREAIPPLTTRGVTSLRLCQASLGEKSNRLCVIILHLSSVNTLAQNTPTNPSRWWSEMGDLESAGNQKYFPQSPAAALIPHCLFWPAQKLIRGETEQWEPLHVLVICFTEHIWSNHSGFLVIQASLHLPPSFGTVMAFSATRVLSSPLCSQSWAGFTPSDDGVREDLRSCRQAG